jgi:hypothetical protein
MLYENIPLGRGSFEGRKKTKFYKTLVGYRVTSAATAAGHAMAYVLSNNNTFFVHFSFFFFVVKHSFD